jgi:two-component system response regulator ResD
MALGTVLVVDDEEQLRSLVRLYLEKEGFRVEEAKDGKDALRKTNQSHYDLIVLDVMMPELDGWEVCRKIRQEQRNTPVIMLTAKTQIEDKLLGFDMGADDYISKPFDPRELVARIQSLLRRTNQENEKDQIILSPLFINSSNRTASVKGQTLLLTGKEFDLLWLMSKNKGMAFSREKLLEIIWGVDFLGESRTVDSHVKNLRDKLRKAGMDDIIHTVWGVGYKLEVAYD